VPGLEVVAGLKASAQGLAEELLQKPGTRIIIIIIIIIAT
jgi:hypothetical protein